MRINAVFAKKVSTGDYENETYTVTFEAESEFNNVAEIADYLFNQARAAVQRQIVGEAKATTPSSQVPAGVPKEAPAGQEEFDPASEEKPYEKKKEEKALPATEKQTKMVNKLLGENFRDARSAKAWLTKEFGATETTKLSRKLASRIIEALIDMSRKVA